MKKPRAGRRRPDAADPRCLDELAKALRSDLDDLDARLLRLERRRARV